MISSLFSSTEIPVLEQVVRFTEARHGVLAGNIANLDTPGYRSRDLSPALFQSRLKEAIEQNRRRGDDEPTPPDSMHAPAATAESPRHNPIEHVQDGLGSFLRHDEGNVGLDQQVTEIAKNQVLHNTAIALMVSQFRTLGAAISERA